MPAKLQESLRKKYEPKARFIFRDRFLNQPESRNIALRETQTPLIAIVDNDIYVRPGWLPAMIRCLRETGAGMVVPLIMEAADVIHCAGTDLLVTYKGGVAYGQHALRCARLKYWKGSDLKRSTVDYGELHCQLLQAEPARKLGVFDELMHEQCEVDSGLMMRKGGYSLWFEPEAVVQFDYPDRITSALDIESYKFKWDVALTIRAMEHFKTKWGMDITECGTWEAFGVELNRKLGPFSRAFPSKAGMFLDESRHRLMGYLNSPRELWRRLRSRRLGSGQWKNYESEEREVRRT